MSALDHCFWLGAYGELHEREVLSSHVTMRVGGPARWFIRVRDREALIELLTRLKAGLLPWCVLGGGSNTMAPDAGVDAIVIQPHLTAMTIDPAGSVMAEAGVITALFARKVTEAGLTGWEWGVGLPGTIGGAIVGNAGCFGGETADGLESVEAWSEATGRVERYTRDEARFRYRESRFSQEPYVVLSARWNVAPAQDTAISRARMQTILAERKTHQPLGAASAGCLFRNTLVTPEQLERLESVLGARVPEPARARGVVPSGWLLDRLGYKGMRSGALQLSPLHANFLLPGSGGSAQAVCSLRDIIQEEVLVQTGIRLVPEIRVLGEGVNVLH